MSVIPEGYGQANLHFTGAGLRREAQVTMGFVNGTTQSPALCADAIKDAWVANMSPLQHSTCRLDSVSVKLGPNDDGPIGDSASGAPGGRALNPESSQVALLFKKYTAAGGRWNNGRLYMPGLPETLVDDGGILDDGYLADAVTGGEAFLSDLVDLNVAMFILHAEMSTQKVDGVTTKIPNPHAGDDPIIVVSLLPQALVATQRRRLRG